MWLYFALFDDALSYSVEWQGEEMQHYRGPYQPFGGTEECRETLSKLRHQP